MAGNNRIKKVMASDRGSKISYSSPSVAERQLQADGFAEKPNHFEDEGPVDWGT